VLLSWDDDMLTLKGPGGEVIFETPTAQAHRIIDSTELDTEGKISFRTSPGR
jgi:hypothetical protein